MLQLHCRTALHLQLAAATSPAQTAATSPASASQQAIRAVPSSQNRQGSAARGTFGQQQADVVAGQELQDEEEDGKACMAAAAEVAMQEGCEVVQKLLRQLRGLGASAVADLMVSNIAPAAISCSMSTLKHKRRDSWKTIAAAPLSHDKFCYCVAQHSLQYMGAVVICHIMFTPCTAEAKEQNIPFNEGLASQVACKYENQQSNMCHQSPSQHARCHSPGDGHDYSVQSCSVSSSSA